MYPFDKERMKLVLKRLEKRIDSHLSTIHKSEIGVLLISEELVSPETSEDIYVKGKVSFNKISLQDYIKFLEKAQADPTKGDVAKDANAYLEEIIQKGKKPLFIMFMDKDQKATGKVLMIPYTPDTLSMLPPLHASSKNPKPS